MFNALDLMENKLFLEELKFGMGDGNLHYYLYNFKCPELLPEKVGVAVRGVWQYVTLYRLELYCSE